MVQRHFESGEIIFRQGEEGGSFFQILDGSVDVFLGYGEEDALMLTRLKKDQFLGEMAVIENYYRSATAVAGPEGAELMEITSGETDAYLAESPDRSIALMKNIGSRLSDLTGNYEEVKSLLREISEDPEKAKDGFFAKRAWKHAKWRGLARPSVDSTINDAELAKKYGDHSQGFSGKIQQYPAGTVICDENTMGNCMYDIHWGRVGIYTGYGTDEELMLTELYPNTFFGEMGMINGSPRSATAVALEETTLEIIFPGDLNELFEKNPPKAFMILAHLSGRLRKLTDQYMAACDILSSAADAVYDNQAISEEQAAKVKAFAEKHFYS